MSEPIATQWVIITGAPSCGKTSLLNALEAQGHTCSPEAARAYFDGKVKAGTPLSELFSWDYSKLGLEIIAFEENSRAHLPKDKRIFLDRVAAIESLAYAEVLGATPNEELKQWPHKYRHHGTVFLLDPLPVVKDGLRPEDDAQAKRLDLAFEKYFKNFGYEVVRVPAFPLDPAEPSLEKRISKSVTQRLDFLLARLNAIEAISEAEGAVKRAALTPLEKAVTASPSAPRPAAESAPSKGL